MTSFWLKYFTLSSIVSINEFKQVNLCWVKQVLELILRSSRAEVVLKISILKSFAKIDRKTSVPGSLI